MEVKSASTAVIVVQDSDIRKITPVTILGNVSGKSAKREGEEAELGNPPKLPLGKGFERFKEGWEGDHRRIGALNNGLPLGSEGGNSKRHSNPMVAVRVDFGSVQLLSAGHAETVLELLNLSSHRS